MKHLAASRLLRPLLPLTLGLVLLGCATAHESDLGANRGYNDLNPGMPAYKPSLASPAKASKNAGKAAPRASGMAKNEPQYSPMVERTATGVRVVKDYSSQARSKTAKANASQTRAVRTQQNSRMAKSYNDENLLTR